MKKFNQFCLLAIMSIFIYSCSEESGIIDNATTKKYGASNTSTYSYINAKGENISMLKFKNCNEFVTTMELLSQDNDAHNAEFYSQFEEDFKNDTFYVIEEDYGFNNQEIYENFENKFIGFTSLRNIYIELENKYLSEDSLKEENDPFVLYPFTNEELTLLNKYGEVKFGDTIVVMTKDGYIAITDGDIETLNKFHNGDNMVFDQKNVMTNLKIEGGGECFSNLYGRDVCSPKLFLNNGQELVLSFIQMIIHKRFQTYWFYLQGYSESNVYVHTNNGWKTAGYKRRMSLYLNTYSPFDCNFEYQLSESKLGTSHSLKVSRSKWWDGHLRGKLGQTIRLEFRPYDGYTEVYTL